MNEKIVDGKQRFKRMDALKGPKSKKKNLIEILREKMDAKGKETGVKEIPVVTGMFINRTSIDSI